MKIRWRVFKEQFFPTAGTMMLLAAALGLLIIGFGCSIAFAVSSPDVENPGSVGILVGFFVIPVVALVIIISAIREKRPGPRAILWFLVALLMVLAGLVLTIAMALDPDMGLDASGFIFFAFCAPVALVFFLPAVYFAFKARPKYRAALALERAKQIMALIDSRGAIRIADLAQALSIPEADMRAQLDELVGAGTFKGKIYDKHGLVYGQSHLRHSRSRLLAVVRARGRIHVEDLAYEMGTPVALLKEWVYYLVQQRRFTGYINWQEGLLYSAEAQQLREGERCPHCSGEMSLAGKGVVQCPFCGAEVFL